MQCLGWELGWRRTWLVLAAVFTLWPFVAMVGGGPAGLLGGPYTWGGRAFGWCVAGFFWAVYIIHPTLRYLALVWAMLLTLVDAGLVLNRLNIIQEPAHPSNLEIIGFGLLACFLLFCHFRSRIDFQR